MNRKVIFLTGMLGVSLLLTSFILGGLLIENYDILSQFISESYAIDTEYGLLLRIFGYIPSGILIALFCFLSVHYFQPNAMVKIGFYGIGIFYGIGSSVTGIFPCDSGCNKELIDPSLSQLIHNFAALLMYLLAPFFLILIGFGLKKSSFSRFSRQSIFLGIISFILICVLGSELVSEYTGLYQRMIELTFILWVIFCAYEIKSNNSLNL